MSRNIYGERLARRQWLRPKWYVLDTGGGGWIGSAVPGTVSRLAETVPANCTDCGIDLGRSWCELPSGPSCRACRDARWPFIEPPAWKRPLLAVVHRTIWPLSSAVDRLYWWHCERFGKRVML